MASKLAPRSFCVHNSKGDDFDFGGGVEKGCCGKVRWNTVRKGEIWINGLFCEQEIYMHTGNYDEIDSHGAPDSWINGHSEVDWIAKEIAFQDFILNESSTNQSDVHQGRTDFTRDEHDSDVISMLAAVAALFGAVEAELSDPPDKDEIENPSQMKTGKQREWALIDPVNSGESNFINTSYSSLSQSVLLQTDWSNGSHPWNGFKTLDLEDQLRVCHSSGDFGSAGGAALRAFKGNFKSPRVPDFAVQDLFQEIAKASQSYKNNDVCARSRLLGQGPQWLQSIPFQSNTGMTERDLVYVQNKAGRTSRVLPGKEEVEGDELFVDVDFENEHADFLEWTFTHGDRRFSLPDKEQFESKEPYGGIDFENGHTDNLQDGFEASRYGFVCESEMTGSSGARGSIPLICGILNRSAEARDETSFLNADADSNDNTCDGSTFCIVPPDALFYAISYLNLLDILSMERVCTSLRDWIRNDVLLWQRLYIEPPLNKKFTDGALLQLAARSKGQLRCLSLVDCVRVTEGAVKQVVSSSPRLSKLCLPGCSRISADAVVRIVKSHTEQWVHGMPGLKQLRIRNIYGLTREHLDSLLTMLGPVDKSYTGSRKPQFYHNGHYSFFCDDQRPIDVEACPKCSNVRLVYDCTRERCQQKQDNKLQECRGCILCIARCEECGRCINDNDYEETFCLDLLCSSCWLRLPKCSECNRPGCGRHADHFVRTPDTTFVCSDCCGSFPGGSGPEFHVYG